MDFRGRDKYTLPELPPRASPRLEHRGFREHGTGAAKQRLEKLDEKVLAVRETEKLVDEGARRLWFEAFSDLRDAEEAHTIAREMLSNAGSLRGLAAIARDMLSGDKRLKALQEPAARLFAEVQWELRDAMVRCGGLILANKDSRERHVVREEQVEDCMGQLDKEEKDLKRTMLQTAVGNPVTSQVGSPVAVGIRYSQVDAATEGEESDDDAELRDEETSQHVNKDGTDGNFMSEQHTEDIVAGLERKVTLLQLFRETVVSMARGQTQPTQDPASGLNDRSFGEEDQHSWREGKRRREKMGQALEGLHADITTTLTGQRPRVSVVHVFGGLLALPSKKRRSWLKTHFRIDLDDAVDLEDHNIAKRLLLALTERLVRDITRLEKHVDALHTLSREFKLLPHLRRLFETEQRLEHDWVHQPRGPVTGFPQKYPSFEATPAPQGTYENLAKNQFRILVLQPSPEPYYPLICTLETWSIYDALCIWNGRHPIQYAALSYSWGLEDNNGRIYMLPTDHGLDLLEPNGWGAAAEMATEIRIRNNLFRALLRLRRCGPGAKPVALWVDSICINQEDAEEKTVQLPQMVDVYNRATNVCIWLGEGDDEGRSDKAMSFITDIMDFAVLDRYAHDKRQAEKWYALSELMRDRWFSRRWVVQEISLAENATVHCGESVVQWSDFSDAVSLLVSNQEMIRSLFDPSEWREGHNTLGDVGSFGAAILLEATSNLFLRDAYRTIKKPLKTVEALVTSLTTFDASDPRDLIYSVVAIASDTSRRVWNPFASPRQAPPFELTADYKQSSVNVYKTFTKFCVLTSKSLDIICRPWAMPLTVLDEGMQFMPSWIPLLSRSEFGAPEEIYSGRKNGEVLVGPAGSPIYCASGNLGNITDAKSSDVRFLLGREGDVLRAKGKLLGVISHVSQRTTGGVILCESLRMGGWRGIEAGGHSVPDSVWRTLVADRGRDGRVAPPWYQRACLRCLEMADRFNNGDLNVGELLQGHSRMLREYLLRVRVVTWSRRFFAIEMSLNDVKRAKPDYGLCPPETQVGDMVCVLFGCSVPVVLREMSDGHVELVGEAYLHGYMDGEGVEGLNKYDVREYKIR